MNLSRTLIITLKVVFLLTLMNGPSMEAMASPVTLVRDGEPVFVIVTSDLPSPAANEGVLELNYWIQRITGVQLPVVKVSGYDGTTPYIAVGSSSLTEENGWNDDAFQQEEARVFIEADRIGLLGDDRQPQVGVLFRGTYYAVLELVQKEFGVRWIWPGESGEVFQKRSSLEVGVGSWSWAPQLTLLRTMRNGFASKGTTDMVQEFFRYFSTNPVAYRTANQFNQAQADWLKRQRMNRSSSVTFSHKFTEWWALYSKDHPDWFAKPPDGVAQLGGRGVKLNLSNPEVHDKVIQDWKRAWQTAPEANKFLDVGPNDSRGFDTRPETRAWDAPELQHYSDKEIYNGSEPVLSDRYVKFWNIIARRAKEIDPEVRVTTLAYRNYRTPPLTDLTVEDNVIIAYVGGEGYYPDERFIVDEWKGWAEKGATLVWRPNLLHAGHGIPYLYSEALYEDFRFFHERGLVGTDFDSLTGNWAGQGLNYYIVAELHSRPDASYEELTDEYFAAFGPASDPIKRYHEFFEKRTQEMPQIMRDLKLAPNQTWGGWWIAHIRLVPIFLAEEVIAQADCILAEALRAVQGADPIYKKRVEFIQMGFEHAKLMADTFRRLRLDHPNVKVSFEEAREVLQPLWDFRLGASRELMIPVLRYLMEEERQLGIWAAFRSVDPTLAAVPSSSGRVDLRVLDKGWEFRVDPTNQGVTESWYRGNKETWMPVQVGVPWRRGIPNVEESKIGWYRLTFHAPERADTGGRANLIFGSIDAEARIWLNGEQIHERAYPHNGNYDSWNESFGIDVTSHLNMGGQNELVVRVESESDNAGITGQVTLIIQ